MNIKLSILLSILFICITSCNSDDDSNQDDNSNQLINCTEIFVSGLSITLTDATTSNIITSNIEVIAKDGDYTETLEKIETSTSFTGAGERTGTYTITVTSDNYQTFTSNPITVLKDECHVITKVLEFSLQPK